MLIKLGNVSLDQWICGQIIIYFSVHSVSVFSPCAKY